MAQRRLTKWAQDQDGPVVGGTVYEGRVYVANTLTLATLWLDSGGSFSAANPHSPNAGTQTSSSANMLTSDTSITVLSTTGFAVGDLVPIDGSAGRFYGVIRTVTDATHLLFTQTLAQMGGGATMNSGALVGGPEMTGHWQAYAADTSDYDFTLKNTGTGKEGPPEGLATLQTAATLAVQEEGSTVSTRGTMNFIGARVTATDNGGSNRADITIPALLTTKGDLMTYNSGEVRKAVGSNNQVLVADSAQGDGLKWAAAILANASALMGSDVTPTSGTWSDLVSVSLAAGTWLLIGYTTARNTQNGQLAQARLYDGTSTFASGEAGAISASTSSVVICVAAIVTPGSTTTYKLQGNSLSGSTTVFKAATVNNGVGNNATGIVAVQIA